MFQILSCSRINFWRCFFYTTAIDIWSTGCVFAELILGTPIFAGESGVDQLVEIIKVLGTPTRKQIHCMNPDYKDYNKFPSIKRHPWDKLFPADTPAHVLDLIGKMLRYTPSHRILPLECLCHPFFDTLRQEHTKTDGIISHYFDFTADELETARNLGIINNLFAPEELKKLTDRYDVNKPVKPARTIHQTSESSSSKEDLPTSDDD